MARITRKAGRVRQPTSPIGSAERLPAEDGFALLEIVCVIGIISLLTAIILPYVSRSTSRAKLEAYAFETAALLKADRYAAIRRRTSIATQIDVPSRLVRSGATGHQVRIPDDVGFDAVFAARCGNRPAEAQIVFFASGMSCGGVVAMTRPGSGFHIRVNWLTGSVEIVPTNQL
jgi:general secretion pathway protein H